MSTRPVHPSCSPVVPIRRAIGDMTSTTARPHEAAKSILDGGESGARPSAETRVGGAQGSSGPWEHGSPSAHCGGRRRRLVAVIGGTLTARPARQRHRGSSLRPSDPSLGRSSAQVAKATGASVHPALAVPVPASEPHPPSRPSVTLEKRSSTRLPARRAGFWPLEGATASWLPLAVPERTSAPQTGEASRTRPAKLDAPHEPSPAGRTVGTLAWGKPPAVSLAGTFRRFGRSPDGRGEEQDALARRPRQRRRRAGTATLRTRCG
ncbi:hypothetical protein DCS_05198 [Drechmeria coniospora]|uniref:Uncharacterized protein n=1 Tax=Drechmeria coniospora TaxID=98403 RepID=A0A151GM44_DRECN|nr:hypothetical protein DCS_05198 [Drechmeria coniospora]KYK58185.1 hypothetical protein DCS_05198 [Drechmeria coniospora]